MLPAPKTTRFSLADVLPNCLDALAGRRGHMGLAGVTHAVVLLVDGLGRGALEAHAGHARTLAARLPRDPAISSGFPTTTAAALATLTTGTSPGRHGLVGYRAFDAARDRVINQLNGWEAAALDPATWQRMPTIFERATDEGVHSVAIGAPRYRDSGFTQAVLRGAEFRSGTSISDRFERAATELTAPGPRLVYLYVPELDVAAHAHGLDSGQWIAALETLDAAVTDLVGKLGPAHGLLVTADHGVVDVPTGAQIVVAPELLIGVRHVAGEPRCLQLHLEAGADPDELAERWRAFEGARAWVATRTKAVAAGWFGDVDPEVLPRIGDVLVAARKRVAYYVDPADKGRGMVGQHGSFSPDESLIPLLKFGSFGE